MLFCDSCQAWTHKNIERDCYYAPVFDILDGKTEPEESAYFYMSDLSRVMRSAMISELNGIQHTTDNVFIIDPRKMDTPIEDLGLRIRTLNLLKRANCVTLADVKVKSVEELPSIRNFGKRSLNEINDILKAYEEDNK